MGDGAGNRPLPSGEQARPDTAEQSLHRVRRDSDWGWRPEGLIDHAVALSQFQQVGALLFRQIGVDL